jgi:peptidoglycan/LPS O-acetylase OafA/YrhL
LLNKKKKMEESAKTNKSTKLKYIPAFDGIRGLFCIIVISHHLPALYFRTPVAIAWETLHAFFVMSGFLITMILLKEKAKYEFKEYTRVFYLKRIYRIFPLYFAFVFFIVIFGYFTKNMKAFEALQLWPDIKQNWGYLISYTYNLKEIFYLVNHRSPILAHLWSLSLEEQFYIFFPFIVYFLSLKNLRRFILFVIIASPIIRALGLYYLNTNTPETVSGMPEFDKLSYVSWILQHNTLFQLDTLCCGAALAIFDFSWLKKPLIWFYVFFFAFIILLVFNGFSFMNSGLASNFLEAISESNFMGYNYQPIYIFSLGNFLTMLLILVTFEKNNPFKVFENKWIIEVGKISYGMYILHMFVMAIYLLVLKKLHLIPKLDMYKGHFFLELIVVLGYYAVLVFICKLSYKYFESYFLRLKDKIEQ